MNALDVGVIIAVITTFGGFAGGLVTLFSSKNQKVIDLIAHRLEKAEQRLDVLEAELHEERGKRLTLMAYSESLHNWSRRAWSFICSNHLQFDPPPIKQPIKNADVSSADEECHEGNE